MSIRVASDVGGTFTDLVYLETTKDGKQRVGTTKSNTTPPNFEQGVLNSIEKSGLNTSEISYFAHGTTVVINALTERRGAKTALITSAGFRDILEIARGNRPDMFNLQYQKPEPFVPRYLRREIAGRISYQGDELKPVDLTSLPQIVEDFKTEGVEAVAICMLNSYVNPKHEELIAAELSKIWPEVFVATSTKVTCEWREYERTSTAVLSAYVKPIARKYLTSLEHKLEKSGCNVSPYIMQSNCGVDTLANSREVPIVMVESGPASGVWAAKVLGESIGENNIIALDIGGTTAKCSLIENGKVKINTDYCIERSNTTAGFPIMAPVIDLVEIGNGGGSIAWVDSYKQLHVGPQSMGASPGPAAYGQGGDKITTTDANLVLSRINPDYFCGGEKKADMESVNTCLDILAKEMTTDSKEAARSVIRIANNNMVNAIKLVSVNRGYDPRDFTMVGFGGGGGMHACFLAKELGIRKVVIPRQSSVFSAWGMLMCDLRRDFLQTKVLGMDSDNILEELNNALHAMEDQAMSQYVRDGIEEKTVVFERYGSFRYRNQAHPVEVRFPDGILDQQAIQHILEQFNVQYKREYTFTLDNTVVELVSFHLIAKATVDQLQPVKLSTPDDVNIDKLPLKSQREVDFSEYGVHNTAIIDGEQLLPGMQIAGPAIIEAFGSTVVIPPGMCSHIDEFGNVQIITCPTELSDNSSQSAQKNVIDIRIADDAITREIIISALQAIADEMFAVIRRTAMSSIIYEVLDMGTAITTKNGDLASSGAGIPAFSNTLDLSVKSLLKRFDFKDIHNGDIFLVNDPYNGGITHLNDMVLLMPVFDHDDLVAWSANIAHWNDVGGMQPGSMATDAKEIFQEGMIIPGVKLFCGGVMNESVMSILKANSRMPDYLCGDLMAGVSALKVGERRLLELVEKYGKACFLGAIADCFDMSEQVTLDALKKLPHGEFSMSEKQENDVTFSVSIEIKDDSIVVDLRNNPDEYDTPFNVARDCVVIASQLILKSVTSPNTQCNSGSFRPLTVVTRPGSVFDPTPGKAMGFYYETFVRVYDLLWRCMAGIVPDIMPAGNFASVCGTVIGGKHPDTGRNYTVIEPELGGWGANAQRDGNPALFCGLHGDTYNCPAEINEARNGFFVDRMAFHSDDGGEGQYRGGRGVCIDYRIRAEDGAILIASYTRSKIPPWSLNGGRDGSTNYIQVIRADGQVEKYSQANGIALRQNDIVRIVTANGAGWGDPKKRDRALVDQDIKNGYITVKQAKDYYGFEVEENRSFFRRLLGKK